MNQEPLRELAYDEAGNPITDENGRHKYLDEFPEYHEWLKQQNEDAEGYDPHATEPTSEEEWDNLIPQGEFSEDEFPEAAQPAAVGHVKKGKAKKEKTKRARPQGAGKKPGPILLIGAALAIGGVGAYYALGMSNSTPESSEMAPVQFGSEPQLPPETAALPDDGMSVPQQLPAEQIPTTQPAQQPPVEQPPVEQPPVEQPPVEQPPIEQIPVEQPAQTPAQNPNPTGEQPGASAPTTTAKPAAVKPAAVKPAAVKPATVTPARKPSAAADPFRPIFAGSSVPQNSTDVVRPASPAVRGAQVATGPISAPIAAPVTARVTPINITPAPVRGGQVVAVRPPAPVVISPSVNTVGAPTAPSTSTPAEPPAPVVKPKNELERWTEEAQLSFGGLSQAEGGAREAIFNSQYGPISVAVGQLIPGTNVTVTRADANAVTLTMKNMQVRLPFGSQP